MPETSAPPASAAISDAPETSSVTVRYFAAAKAALGVGEEVVDLRACGDVGALIDRAPVAARPVLERCSFLVDGVTTTERTTPLRAGGLVDVLPPFAGG